MNITRHVFPYRHYTRTYFKSLVQPQVTYCRSNHLHLQWIHLAEIPVSRYVARIWNIKLLIDTKTLSSVLIQIHLPWFQDQYQQYQLVKGLRSSKSAIVSVPCTKWRNKPGSYIVYSFISYMEYWSTCSTHHSIAPGFSNIFFIFSSRGPGVIPTVQLY